MNLRSTRTMALMAIPSAAYNLIRRQLEEAAYQHAILPSEAGGDSAERLDMHGIGLIAEEGPSTGLRLAWNRHQSGSADPRWEATAGHLRLVVFDRSPSHVDWDVMIGMAAGTLRRAQTLEEGQIAAEEEARQIMGEMLLAFESTPTDELLRSRFLRWRGIQHAEDVCRTCDGAGVRMYSNTSGWRRGMGGAMCTMDVCDACWGTGDRWKHGADLRKLREEEGDRIAKAAVDALAQSVGATFSSAAPQVFAIVKLLRDAVEEADKGGGRGARKVSRAKDAARRDSIWFAPLAKGLADMLERAVRAK